MLRIQIWVAAATLGLLSGVVQHMYRQPVLPIPVMKPAPGAKPILLPGYGKAPISYLPNSELTGLRLPEFDEDTGWILREVRIHKILQKDEEPIILLDIQVRVYEDGKLVRTTFTEKGILEVGPEGVGDTQIVGRVRCVFGSEEQ